MSDELERRLREAGHRLPHPDPDDTAAARRRVLSAAAARGRHRPLVLALAAALAVGGAFGVGYAVASAGNPPPKLIVRHVPTRLDAGPGFLPAPGWYTTSSQTGAGLAAVASNVAMTPGFQLSSNTVVIRAQFAPASSQPSFPRKLLPLQLADAATVNPSARSLHARVAGYAIDVSLSFGPNPTAAALAAAREELGRLVVPACPAARELAPSDVAAAKRYVLGWLPAHYAGDTTGATATAHLGTAMPRVLEAVHDCGRAVALRSIEVDVVLPKLAKISASLSQLTYFVAKTASGWTVWERAR